MKFNKKDLKTLNKIITSRRDVRGNNFTNKKISSKKLDMILKAAINSPSVGYSQPWKFVIVSKKDRDKVYKHFTKSFESSKEFFEDRPLYKDLKLEGIKEADINIAVFYEKPKSKVLGQTYMKKAGEYSVVCAIMNMWLTARALNIGLGWVSIVKPKKMNKIFKMKKSKYKFIAYLCLGYTKEFYDEPELKLLSWEKKKELEDCIIN